MVIAGIQKLTLLDYPEHIACIIFIRGCNLRCPFCHNSSILEFNNAAYTCSDNTESGIIQDKDYIGMSKDSSICYDLGTIKPQEKRTLEICVLIDENSNVLKQQNFRNASTIFKICTRAHTRVKTTLHN